MYFTYRILYVKHTIYSWLKNDFNAIWIIIIIIII